MCEGMKLFLIRHGESTANVEGLVTGSINTPLTAIGRRQVEKLYSQQISQMSFDVIFSSPAKRALETTDILFPNSDIIVTDALLETDAGEVSEWSLAKFNQHYPDFWTHFEPNRSYPGGESHYDLYVRVNEWMDTYLIKYKEAGNIAIVTHGGPINCMLHRTYGQSMTQFPYYHIANASSTELSGDRLLPKFRGD